METDTATPAVEFKWGALPNVHLHVIIPAVGIIPSNNPGLAPAGVGPRAFGLGDIELGIKYRFVQESKHLPMVGMFVIPTGNAAKGLGVGKTWYKLPLWAQKSFGPWTTYAGGGVTLMNAPGYRNFPYAGWLVQRDLGKKWTLGIEVFYHGPEGPATAQTRPATLVDFGGYYKFRDPGFSYCSVTATRPLDKGKIMPIWGSIGHGEIRKRQATNPTANPRESLSMA